MWKDSTEEKTWLQGSPQEKDEEGGWEKPAESGYVQEPHFFPGQ